MIKKLCNTLIVFILVAVIALLVVIGSPFIMGNKIYAVLTASMEPTYPVGSLVVVEPTAAEEIKTGDVITFDAGGGFNALATHRVIEINAEQEEFITKGDNNRVADLAPVPYSSLQGRVSYGIPYLGNIVSNLRTSKGIMAATGILMGMIVLLIVPELFNKKDSEKTE